MSIKKIYCIAKISLLAMIISSCLLLIQSCTDNESKYVTIHSNDGKISCKIWTGNEDIKSGGIKYSINYLDKEVVLPSGFQLNIDGDYYNGQFSIEDIKIDTVSQKWTNNFGEQREILDEYIQVKFFLKNSNKSKINFICRVYNEGVAFAYELPELDKSVTISKESFNFSFDDNYYSWVTQKAQGEYSKKRINEIVSKCEVPLLVEKDSNIKVAIAEASLVDYSSMKIISNSALKNTISTTLSHPAVKERPFQSPWRVVMIAESRGQLLEQNYILQNLNPSSEIDTSWITPGKVLREGELTTDGGMACVDFAASHNMQYVEFDAGWYGPENDMESDATTITLDEKRSKGPLDLQKVINYGKQKDIRVILYVNRRALENQLDDLLPLYSSWGVKGLKYGFVSVDTQESMEWLHDAIRKTAEYKMIVDIHDEYRPTGFSRTYPNLLTQEGIRGDEESISNTHTLITMFTRMLGGAADNTICYYDNKRVAKMGSHASQLAKAVCMFSPIQFLYWYDKPRVIENMGTEDEIEFFDNVPTVWDETKVLADDIGKFAVIARRKGNDWFVGAINGENNQEYSLDFDFLDSSKNYKCKIYQDDEQIDSRTKVRVDELNVNCKSKYDFKIKSNNGFAMHLECE